MLKVSFVVLEKENTAPLKIFTSFLVMPDSEENKYSLFIDQASANLYSKPAPTTQPI